MEAEEVDAILEREDLRLAVQAQAQRLDVRLDLLEDLPEQQLVAADDVEVVHVTAIDEAEAIPQPVVEVYGKDEPLLWLIHLEGVVGPEGVLAPLEAVREVGRALDGLHAVAHGRGVVPLPAAGLAVCFV